VPNTPNVTSVKSSSKHSFAAPFVVSDGAALRAVVVVRPAASIAAVEPVHGESHPIADRAAEQHRIFTGVLSSFGIATIEAEPDAAAPFGPLCADGAVIFADGAFLMRPSDLRRRSEVAALEEALARVGIPIVGRIDAPGLLDGGDVMVAGDTVYIGVAQKRQAEIGISSAVHGNAFGREQLAAYAISKGARVVEVPMAAEVRRLKSVASFIAAETVLFSPGLLDGAAFDGLQKIEAPRGEDYGAGVLALGNKRVLANLRFRETTPLLRKAKFTVESIDLWEFGKIGATPSVMALALKRG
jgi:dimethylargininase